MLPVSPLNFLSGAAPSITQNPVSHAIGGTADSRVSSHFDDSGWQVQIGSGLNVASGPLGWLMVAALAAGAVWFLKH